VSPEAFDYVFRAAFATPGERGAPPPVYGRSIENGMTIERNVAVRMRDGVEIFADVFRPIDEGPVPPIIAWTPYGKHQNGSGIYAANPTCDVKPGQVSQYATFEAVDPLYWVPRGYAVVNVDIRGLYYSKGDATVVSPEEARDFYDTIEWAGTQSWSNGRVGLSGVSYLAVTQWRVAELNPPHLAAINPWEGWTDTYRELARHGGIPDTWFWTMNIAPAWGCSTTPVEDILAETAQHPFIDAFWESKAAKLEKVSVPAFVVACWADQGLHERGTLEGFKRIASKQKWLLIHGRKKWAHYYDPQNVELLREFFDHFLKGTSASVLQWPRVRYELRQQYFMGETRTESEWPIARTQYTKLYLDAQHRCLQSTLSTKVASANYDSMAGGPLAHRAEFELTFTEPTDLVGHMKLKLWAAAESADDMDLFVGLYKFDAHGQFVPFPFYSFFDDGPVALGWLRASHSELDPDRSTEYQPVLAHRRARKLEAGEVVPLEIEIWPSGTHFEAGSRLRLIVQGTDLQKYSKHRAFVYFRHEDTVNSGRHIVYTGGKYDSHLLVPIVPRR